MSTFRIEVWSSQMNRWIVHPSFSNRRDADECKASWERIGVQCRVTEIQHRAGPDFVNHRGE